MTKSIDKRYLNDNLQRPVSQGDLDLSKITFYTKEEFDGIFLKEYMDKIDHIFRYNSENEIDNFEYIKELKSQNLDSNFLKDTLTFMISRGNSQAYILKKEFNIDTSNISVDIFLEGFKNGKYDLLDNDSLIEYIKLYKDRQELLESIGNSGDIVLLSDLIYTFGFDFDKFDDNQIDNILLAFKNTLNTYKFFDKINIIGFYNWNIIFGELFEHYDLVKNKIQDIFDFSEEEKEKFEKLKESHFFTNYQNEIQTSIESFEDMNFQKIMEFTYNDTYETEIDFHKKITEHMIGLNHRSSYSVVFLDISGRKEQFNIGNGAEIYGYNYNLLEKKDYLNSLSETYGDFKLNLYKNNMDFSILIFKQNGDKDDIPDEDEEELRVAA